MRKLKQLAEILRPRINLKFWEGKGELLKIARIFDKWWDTVQQWIGWLPLQIDIDKAPIQLVNMVAYQRDITRFKGEPEELYRRRVKYAFLNAKDAGSIAGFFRIWKRLELGALKQHERIQGQDWDIIELEIDDIIFSKYQLLFEKIIRKYGRTCRRYVLATRHVRELGIRPFGFCFSTTNTLAKAKS